MSEHTLSDAELQQLILQAITICTVNQIGSVSSVLINLNPLHLRKSLYATEADRERIGEALRSVITELAPGIKASDVTKTDISIGYNTIECDIGFRKETHHLVEQAVEALKNRDKRPNIRADSSNPDTHKPLHIRADELLRFKIGDKSCSMFLGEQQGKAGDFYTACGELRTALSAARFPRISTLDEPLHELNPTDKRTVRDVLLEGKATLSTLITLADFEKETTGIEIKRLDKYIDEERNAGEKKSLRKARLKKYNTQPLQDRIIGDLHELEKKYHDFVKKLPARQVLAK